MKFRYRNATHDSNPANVATHPPLPRTFKLIYRGNTYKVNPLVITEISLEPLVYELSYRGNTYQFIHNEQGQITAIA
jgi:Domain of unknown function (DUF4278)